MSKRSMISRKHKKFTYLIIIVFLISIFGGLFSNFHSTQRSVPGSGQGVANLGQEYFIGNNESLGTKPAYSSILHGTGFLPFPELRSLLGSYPDAMDNEGYPGRNYKYSPLF
jgi:hypothetical protein